MRTKAAIFDIDGTLYDYDIANEIAVKALSEYMSENFGWDQRTFQEENRRMMLKLHHGMGDVAATHNRLIRYQNILEEHRMPLFPHAMNMYKLYWGTLLDSLKPFPDIDKTFHELKRLGIRIGIGSNMTALVQYLKLERLDLLRYVDFIVTSEEACAEKPDRKLFELCIKKAEAEPDECLFIGDSYKNDYCGAKDAGMRALWFVPQEKQINMSIPEEALTDQIKTFPEILERLKMLT